MKDVPSHEVSSRVVWGLIRMLERADLPTSKLFDGLPYDVTSLKGRHRLPWDDYGVICDNLLATVGSQDALNDLAEDNYHEVFPELRVVAGALIEPKVFVRFVLEVIDPMVWGGMHAECTDLGGNDMRVVIRIRPGAKGNAVLVNSTVGALRGFTRHLDLPPTKILRTELSPTFGLFDIRLPESRTLLKRARRLSRSVLQRVTASLLYFDGDVSDPLETRLDEVAVDWELSRRQIEVLRCLVQGQANKEIAQALDCAENTVELHVTQIFKKAKVSARGQLIARFWRGD